MRVFITGGTGLVGIRLIRRLRGRGDDIVLLSRRAEPARARLGDACKVVEGDPVQAGAWQDAVNDCDAVVHLAGASVFARRWNDAYKAEMYDSRVKSAENIVRALARQPRTARGASKILVSASATGFYGPHGDEELTEDSPPGSDFLARLCVAWEHAAQQAEPLGVRVALLRIGVVLDREGGALRQLLTPFKLGVGGPVGSGKQWMSWIHHEDLTGILLLALDNGNAAGPLNGTAPEPVPNKAFGKALGRALHRPAFLPTPGFALRLALGEVADVVTKGQRVLPKKALALGYTFRFPTIDQALADVLK